MGRPARHIDTNIGAFLQSEGFKILDLCCCSGVSAEGLLQVQGVKVLGVDIMKPSYYPATFLQEDVLKLPLTFVQLFNFVWASPPCQIFSRGTEQHRANGKQYPNILPQVRELLMEAGVPAIIENVPESGLYPHFMLCGSMFGLPITRHRHFEALHWKPEYKRLYCNHKANKGNNHVIAGSFRGTVHDAANSLGCYPTRLRSEIKEGVPPAYSRFILESFLATLPDCNKSLDL